MIPMWLERVVNTADNPIMNRKIIGIPNRFPRPSSPNWVCASGDFNERTTKSDLIPSGICPSSQFAGLSSLHSSVTCVVFPVNV